MASLVFVSTGGSCFKPSLIRPIKQQGNRGKDITSNYAMFIIDQKIASAKRLSQKQHVYVYSLRHAFVSVESEEFKLKFSDWSNVQTFYCSAREKSDIRSCVQQHTCILNNCLAFRIAQRDLSNRCWRIIMLGVILRHCLWFQHQLAKFAGLRGMCESR